MIAIRVESAAKVPANMSRHVEERLREADGSGFIISADGLALTNWHVVDNAKRLTAKLHDGREVPIEVVGGDASIDVALIRLVIDGPVPWVPLGDSDAARVGDWVVAIGNPLGLGTTVTAGIVSAKGRVLDHDVRYQSDDFIQTDAAINQGNSGGPLFDLDGRVIGMNTAIIQGANTIGFAIPSSLLLRVLPDLKASGRVVRGFLGINPRALDAALAKAVGVPSTHGALVAQVYADTPASRVGIAAGDVVVMIDGQDIRSPNDLVREVSKRRPGDTLELHVLRGAEKRKVKLVLEERPEPSVAKAPTSVDPLAAIGLAVRDATSDNSKAASADAVYVAQVTAGRPAAGRLIVGDRLIEVDKTPVSSVSDVRAALTTATLAEAHVFIIERDNDQHFVVVPPP